MMVWRNLALVSACALSFLAAPASAQENAQGSQHPGRSVVMSKCFQCHTDAMLRDQRQDRSRMGSRDLPHGRTRRTLDHG